MQYILDILSTRELSLIFWTVIILIAIMFNKNMRSALGGFVKQLFDYKIGAILIILTFYILGFIFALSFLTIWDLSFLKDTIFWFLTVAMVLFFTLNDATDPNYIRNILKQSFKGTMVLEFVVNFYTFNLLVELILMPIIIIVVMTQAYSQTDEKYNVVNKFLQRLLAVIGWAFLIIVTFKTFTNYPDFFTKRNLLSFLLPPIMTILLIPFLYLVAIYINYETHFVRIDFMLNDLKKRKLLKRKILCFVNINLNRLISVSKKFNKFDLYQTDDPESYIRSLTN
ncbi:MAG: hypothetical protein NT144_12900 [Bacteroidia bacterium]|nr:hypothetical protein [Bacteroidia bacterium]